MTLGVNNTPSGIPVSAAYTANPFMAGAQAPAPTAASYGMGDTYVAAGPARAVAPTAPTRNSGLWARLSSLMGLGPSAPAAAAPAAPIANPTVWNRLASFLGFGPPVQPSLTAAPANATFGQRVLNLFHIGRPSVAGPAVNGPATPYTGNLRTMTPAQLKELGRTNKQAFFQALLPAAIEAERRYGVPASVTLAQAALESGWARSPIGGYNIFGIKGHGPAGSTTVATHEYVHGVRVPWVDRFALYHNFEEAIVEHGHIFHNGAYNRGITEFAQNHDPYRFIQNVGHVYATDPHYAQSIRAMMDNNNLVAMARSAGGN